MGGLLATIPTSSYLPAPLRDALIKPAETIVTAENYSLQRRAMDRRASQDEKRSEKTRYYYNRRNAPGGPSALTNRGKSAFSPPSRTNIRQCE
jgi:hypothetical protein